ncbi:unnamed protein product [Mytilus coruscus]|uniref:Uncharacterized protein n=1 Tax=Mytilus coruscus TaxID=42192 RepID=A0A6J8CI31_MYTCO|nr:unnamed protein product [Mytilus coruscus]
MRGLKLFDEALHARLFYQFFLWCRGSQQQIPSDLEQIIHQFETAILESTDVDHFLSLLQTDIEDKLHLLVNRFKAEGRAISPTFKLWDDFLTQVLQPIKILISSTRNGIWKVFQAMQVELLPLLFASNRNNYSRYLTVNTLLMNRLPENVSKHFCDGKFAAKLTSSRFYSVWMDYTIETTENKALKDNGVSIPTDKIVISSPDTDVLVLLMHHRQSIAAENVFFLTGRVGKHASLVRYISVDDIIKELTPSQKRILLPVYCLTGCDTTSSFFGHGKKSAFRLLKQRVGSHNGLTTLGSSDLTIDQFKHCMPFVGDLYDLHNANTAMHEQVDPIMYGYGRDLETDTSMPRLISQSAAAPELLNNLICECDEHNCSKNCTCLENEQDFTAACSCGASADIADETTCNNPMTIEAMEFLSTDYDFDN